MRPNTGYLICLGSNLISWFSKNQPTIYESDYCSLAHKCAETIWIRLSAPILLHYDYLRATYHLLTQFIMPAHVKYNLIIMLFVKKLCGEGGGRCVLD